MHKIALGIGFSILLISGCPNSSDSPERAPHPPSQPDSQRPEIPPKDQGVQELSLYLKKPSFPKLVSELVKIAKQSFSVLDQGPAKDRQEAIATGGASRKPNWIARTFSSDEDEIIDVLKEIAPPQTWTIAAINNLYAQITAKNQPNLSLGLPAFSLVKDFSVTQLPNVPLAYGIAQLASQANYLESPSRTAVPPVSAYINDNTQGPRGSIEAAAAALHRWAAVAANKLPNALHHILPADHKSYYENGYMELFEIKSQDKLAQLNTVFKTQIDQMEILPQWATFEATGKVVLQVMSFAPSYQGKTPPTADSVEGQICDLLVSAQYEAIAKLAVIMSVLTEGIVDVPVHLTLVGQGAFGNPKEVMKTALDKVADVVKGYSKVRVFVHAFTAGSQDEIRKIAAESQTKYSLKELTKDQFLIEK